MSTNNIKTNNHLWPDTKKNPGANISASGFFCNAIPVQSGLFEIDLPEHTNNRDIATVH